MTGKAKAMMAPLLIGVDGGGTLCRAGLILDGTRIEAEGPGANASSDFEGCLARVLEVLEALRVKAGLSKADFAAARAYLGLAGVTGPALGIRLARGLPFREAKVEEDRASSVMGALGTGRGCVAAIGTGSFLARQGVQGLRYQGGYGLVLGDEASGAWLGREALAAALRVQDGWGGDSPLTHDLMNRFTDPQGVIRFVAHATPQSLAELAPMVVDAAQNGDPQGAGLMRRGARYVAEGLTALGWQGEAVALIGGLGPRYAAWLPDRMQAALITPKGSALDGALMLAARPWQVTPAP